MNHTHTHGRRTGASRSALLVLATSQFLLVLDSAIVNVALPSMQVDLHFSPGGLTWVVNIYALLFGGLILLGGRLSDVVGARRVFLVGFMLFGLASAAGALAPTSAALVTARAVQGAGAALVAPAGLALTLILFAPGTSRNRALGMLGAAAGLGGASGAIVGGLLTEMLGWRAILWLNVPVVAVLLARGFSVLPSTPGTAKGRTLDLAGAVTATGAVIGLVYGLIRLSDSRLLSPPTVLPWAVAVVLAGAFVAVERRVSAPLVPPTIVRIRTLRGANTAIVFSSMAMMPMWFLLTVDLQQVHGFGPIKAGLGVLPTVAMLILLNSLAPRIIAAAGTKRPLVVGLFVAAAGLAWLSVLGGPGSGYLGDMLWPQLVTGMGFGLAFVAGTVTSTGDAPVEQSGVASGLLNTAQQVGGAVGLAILATVAAQAGNVEPAALSVDLSHAFLVAASFAAVAAGLAWALIPRPHQAESTRSFDGPVGTAVSTANG